MSGFSIYWFFGELLCLWDTNCFQLSNQFVSDGFIGLEAAWKENGREVVIVNIYAPCDKVGRRNM
ncbi:hypothetical protein AAZX31_01G133300 [Glycine max]